jgi:hypothetical protein
MTRAKTVFPSRGISFLAYPRIVGEKNTRLLATQHARPYASVCQRRTGASPHRFRQSEPRGEAGAAGCGGRHRDCRMRRGGPRRALLRGGSQARHDESAPHCVAAVPCLLPPVQCTGGPGESPYTIHADAVASPPKVAMSRPRGPMAKSAGLSAVPTVAPSAATPS